MRFLTCHATWEISCVSRILGPESMEEYHVFFLWDSWNRAAGFFNSLRCQLTTFRKGSPFFFFLKNVSLARRNLNHMNKFLPALLLCILTSCMTGKRLSETESLIQTDPDSARIILCNWNRSSLLSNRQKALHALLYSMALDKCYIDVADDSLTHIALTYFKGSHDKNHQMKAYYYDGLVQKNQGNIWFFRNLVEA